MFPSHYWAGSMDTYISGSQVLQGHPVHQVMGKTSMPQMQQSVQNNVSLPNLVPNGYQHTHRTNMTDNMVHFSGVKPSVGIPNMKTISQPNYVQNVDNANNVLLWIRNPGCGNNAVNLNLLQGNNQRDQSQNLQLTGQGASTTILATNTTKEIYQNPNVTQIPLKGPVKMPEHTHVNISSHVGEKVGSANVPAKRYAKIPEPTHISISSNIGEKVGSINLQVKGFKKIPEPSHINISPHVGEKVGSANVPAKRYAKIPEPTHISISSNIGEKVGSINLQVKGFENIPEPSHVNINSHVGEKVGSLKIHISESFLPWNITNKTILGLEFMRHLFNISGVDVVLTDSQQNGKAIGAAVDQLLHNQVLSDWLVLKCEEKEIPFLKVNNQIEIYTANNFTALLNIVSQETCLPLPFITEENNFIKYLYLNFPKTGNDKVKKLNVPIFHVADNGKRKLPCKYPGIRLDCDFENATESFTVHVHQSALPDYETSLPKIRQHIIYRHIIWGFLQMWIQRVKEQYNNCFKFGDIARNLSLCKDVDVSEYGNSSTSDNRLIYNIDYLNCYLKFDPVTLKETKASFTMDNFSTKVVCNLSIVQYYKQYFLINDMHYSDALKNTALFFRNCYNKNVEKASSYVNVPARPRVVHNLPKNNYVQQEQLRIFLNESQKNKTNVNLSSNTSGIATSQTSTVRSDENNVIPVEPEQAFTRPMLAKPLLKARTVEEINSSVELHKTPGSSNMEAADTCKITYSKKIEETQRLDYKSFISLIQKFMQICCTSNRTQLSSCDESNKEEVIERRFDEAVRRAVTVDTVESFIEKIYVYLQSYYTNSTCQSILKKYIWKAIEAKYPHFKARISENIAKSLENKSLASDVDCQLKNTSPLEGRPDLPLIGSNENVHHIDHNYNANSSITVLSDKSDIEVGSHRPGENNTSVSTSLQGRNVDPEGVSSSGISQNQINEEESSSTSTNVEANGRNSYDSGSSTHDNSSGQNKEQNEKTQPEKEENELLPYRNTLTLVRVSTSPATFRICTKQDINSAIDSSEIEENESCNTSEKPVTMLSCNIRESEITPEEQERCVQIVEKGGEVEEECPQERDYYEEYNLKHCSVVLNSNDVEIYTKSSKKRKRAEISYAESDSESENDYVPGRGKRRYNKNDSDDSDYVKERKRLKRAVSEIQYMEAKSRVLQRLRKRKSVFTYHDRTRMSGEEFDNFFVRGSSLSKSSYDEDDAEEKDEPEHGNEDEQEIEERDCQTNGSKSSKIQMEKEPVIKELRVLLVRLEDTPEYEKYRDKLLRRGLWNPAMENRNRENFSQIREKYFEIREGKLYLKDDYRVKNGAIIRTNKEVCAMRPKREPESPTREIDIHYCSVKKENVVD